MRLMHFDAILKRSSLNFLVKSLGVLFLFLFNLFLVNTTTAEEYGKYVYVWNLILIGTIPLSFGFKNSLVKLIADDASYGIHALLVVTGATLLIGVPLMLLGPGLGIENTWMVCLLLYLMALINVFDGLLKAHRRNDLSEIPYEIFRPVIATIILSLILYSNTTLTHTNILFSLVLALSIGIAFSLAIARKHHMLNFTAQPTQSKIKNSISFTLPFILISASQIFLKKIDIVMIGYFIDKSSVGIYGLMVQISLLSTILMVSLNSSLAPLIANNSHQLKNIESKIKQFTMIGTLWAVLVLIIFLTMGEWFIATFFGTAYTEGIHVLLILFGFRLLVVSAGPGHLILSMSGHQKIVSNSLLVISVFNVIFNVMLIPRLGLIGAAISTGCSNFIWNLSLLYFVRNILKIKPDLTAIVKKKCS